MQINSDWTLIPFKDRYRDLLSLAAGCLYPLGFAPFGFWPAPIIAIAIFIGLVREASGKRAFWRGWLFGLGMFGLGVSWIQVSVHQFGLPIITFSAGVTALLIAFISLYPAVCAVLLSRAGAFPSLAFIAVTASAWTLTESLRGVLLTGFPWLQTGYSQIDSPLAGYAPVGGVLCISFVVAIIAGLVHEQLRRPTRSRIVCALAATLVLFVAGALLQRVQWTQAEGEKLSAALVQGNVPQAIKWLPNQRQPTLDLYASESEQQSDAELLVWPETAVPAFAHQATEYLSQMDAHASANNQALLIGIPELDEDRVRYYNAVLGFGTAQGSYRKHHLVPFGEYLPLKPILGWLVDYLKIPMSDFSAGARVQSLIKTDRLRIGLSICYEDAYGSEVARALPEANVLVNVSNDAWFGDSLAPPQHEEIARMRALETGRDLLRATNTGISAAINYRGQVLKRTRQFEMESMRVDLQPRRGATPYVALGGWPIPILSVLILGLIFSMMYSREDHP